MLCKATARAGAVGAFNEPRARWPFCARRTRGDGLGELLRRRGRRASRTSAREFCPRGTLLARNHVAQEFRACGGQSGGVGGVFERAALSGCMADARAHGRGAAPRTRHARFSNYRAAECAALVAAVNAHADVVLCPAARGASYFAVVAVGRDATCGAGRAGGGDAAAFWAMLRALEAAAAGHGVVCTNRPGRGGAPPSLEALDLGTAVLRRGDITERGRVVHDILGVLCGGRRGFVLRRGNPYVVGALYAADPGAVYAALCRASGGVRGADGAQHG